MRTGHHVHKGRWMEGLCRFPSIFWAVLSLTAKSKTPEWELIQKMWYDIRRLQILVRLIVSAVWVTKAEKTASA